MLPTERTLRACRALGWLVDVVERRRGGVSVDLFGFADVLAVDPSRSGVVLIQCTTTPNLAARVRKLLSADCESAVRAVLNAGNAVEVWGWGQYVRRLKDGTKSQVRRWECSRRELRLRDGALVVETAERLRGAA